MNNRKILAIILSSCLFLSLAGLFISNAGADTAYNRWFACVNSSGNVRNIRYNIAPSCRSTETIKGWNGDPIIPNTTSTTSLPVTTTTAAVTTTTSGTTTNNPPPAAGYFTLKPVGASLPSDADCAAQVHRSTWEPRPDNTKRNNIMPDANAVHASFAAHPLDSSYDPKINSVILPRVDGQFTGTTDEIFQWAACKWGLSDNLIRGIAVNESTWYQYETYPAGRCVFQYSCGDMQTSSTPASIIFCNELAKYGYDYQKDFGSGICPHTFSIVGVMSYQDPSWGQMLNNQNGTFPFNRDSTAFAVDYLGSYLRSCYEGMINWLAGPGDIIGCAGSWYSGDWYSSGAQNYINNFQNEINNLTWLKPGWFSDKPGCNATYGCPGPDTLP
jgi:hypothetical protein